MARSRNIKPSLFKNEILGSEDPLLTILFESLWTLADREGRLEDRPLRIKAETFPYRSVPHFDDLMQKLVRYGFVQRYQVAGIPLLQIVNFARHQHPHITEKASELPAPEDNGAITVKEPLDNVSLTCSLRLIPDSLNLIPDSTNPSDSLPQMPLRPTLPEVPDEEPEPEARKVRKANGVPYEANQQVYHECLPNNPRCRVLTTKRKAQISARWHSGALPDLATWRKFFLDVAKSRWLTGQVDPQPGRRRFVADLEWLTNETNYAKILEGKYRNG